MPDPLHAVSPLDGRYATRSEPLRQYASEAALARARVQVEVEYLIALAALEATPIAIEEPDAERLRGAYEDFDAADADRIKAIEVDGSPDRPATNHDVKAVEYFLRDHLATMERGDLASWVHFGLTSEDVNNLAYRLLIDAAVEGVLQPALREIADELGAMAREYRDLPMLARTHGQPATPTTFGKEMAVYAARLGRALGDVDVARTELAGKLGGASGTYAAHHAAYPDVDWRDFAREFVTGLGLAFVPLTTQVNPADDLARLFDALRRTNTILLDLDRDIWRYVSDRYLGQAATEGETGSSTMPHKVNPIDFENSEGNLSKANADLSFLAEYLPTSRLQRDLSDSTVKRNIGAALAHCLIGYTKTADGLRTVTPNETVIREDLESTPEVIGEAVQTILRREGQADAYEVIKDLTRGERVTLEDFRSTFDDLEVSDAVREELDDLTPATYTGLGSELVDDLETTE